MELEIGVDFIINNVMLKELIEIKKWR